MRRMRGLRDPLAHRSATGTQLHNGRVPFHVRLREISDLELAWANHGDVVCGPVCAGPNELNWDNIVLNVAAVLLLLAALPVLFLLAIVYT
jgi:hypothetical protein